MAPGESRGAATRARHSWSAVPLTAAAAAVGLATTLLILATPYLAYGYRSPELSLVLDTVDACIAILLAYLLYGRFLRTDRLQDGLLAAGLLLFGIAGLGVAPLLVPGPTAGVWAPLLLRLAAAILVATAALVGERRMAPGRRGLVLWLPWVVAALVASALWPAAGLLPVLELGPPTWDAQPPRGGSRILALGQGLTGLALFVASWSYMRQAARGHDELQRWLGPAFALAAFARVNYVLFPSMYSDWLYTGDLLRTASYAVLTVGAAREISRYWAAQAQVAVLEERRRLARELHDGVAQELAYIRAEVCVLSGDRAGARDVVEACDRALDEARSAIDTLGRGIEEPLGSALGRAASDVASRYGGTVLIEIDESVGADHEQRQALTRIAREAVSNAFRHGGGTHVTLRLQRGRGRGCLVVEDDGRGFDPSTPSARGYGLISMRERARNLPGALEVRSVADSGTEVRVTW